MPTATSTPRGAGRRTAPRSILGWSAALGATGGLAAVLVATALRVDLRSVVAGAGLSLGLALTGLALVFPVVRTGSLALPLVLVLFAAQVLLMLGLVGPLRSQAWIHARPFAFSALTTMLAFQAGAVLGSVRVRTAVTPEAVR